MSEQFKGSSQWGEYGDAIQELDHHVGRIFDSLERLGIDDNTIVIYASDNGRGPGRTPEQPIRGRKLSTYEGGIRVPASRGDRGWGCRRARCRQQLVHAMDWYPTLATFAGIAGSRWARHRRPRHQPAAERGKRSGPRPGMKMSLNASVPLRRRWDPPGEWARPHPAQRIP